jgi:hypothetical protein
MDWADRAIDVGLTVILSGVLIRVFQPAVFDYICYAISRREEVIKRRMETMFARELAEQKAVKEMVDTHKDILEFIVTSIKRTNEELPAMVQVLNRVADSVDTLTVTCERLNEGQTATQIALGRLEERSEWFDRIHALDIERLGGRPSKRFSDHLHPDGGA